MALCLHPTYVYNKYTNEKLVVPCGKCETCKHSRASHWVQRLRLESSQHKYVVFFTLTYSDTFVPKADVNLDTFCLELTDKEQKNFLNDEYCQDYIAKFDYNINVLSVSDVQNFMKRLRKKIYQNEKISENQKYIRYYIAGEYGPSKFKHRPHYHGLLFFDNDVLAKVITAYIREAWSSYDVHSRTFTPFGRIDVQFASGKACDYVSQYLNCFSCLPSVLQISRFRPFHVFSKFPPIGFNACDTAQIREIFFNGNACFMLQDPLRGSTKPVFLWRTFESKIFPKFTGYCKISDCDRAALYGLSNFTRCESRADFREWLRSKRSQVVPSGYVGSLVDYYDAVLYDSAVRQINDLFIRCFDDFDLDDDAWFESNTFKSVWHCSSVCSYWCSQFDVSPSKYTSLLSQYYSNKNYELLKLQLQSEESYLAQGLDLRYLLHFVDPLIFNNDRFLPIYTLDIYFKQFGFTGFRDLSAYGFANFSETEFVKSKVENIITYVTYGKSLKKRNAYIRETNKDFSMS